MKQGVCKLCDFRLMTGSVNAIIALAKQAYLTSLISQPIMFSVNLYKSPSGQISFFQFCNSAL